MFFWCLYYFFLIVVCFSFSRINKNKFINFFFIPIILGLFGSFWFIEPGSSKIAPIISILFLESTILETNGFNRLIRPMISSIFLFELLSLFIYIFKKNFLKSYDF